jgi:molecular chaperone GrpE (heat shock protein)
MAHNFSTVGNSQSISSTQSQEFATLQEHIANLNEKYEQLFADYEELR